MRAALAALVVAACGGAPEVAPATTSRAASPIATSSGPTDEIVAQVNGRPVWASCVAAQGAKVGDRQQALDQCIAFELLAQEADKRGLGEDPEVVDATRTAIVNRLVETGFEDRYAKPSDLGDRLEKWFRENEWRLHRPELRSSIYARAAGHSPEAEKAARAIYDKLANRTGLFPIDLQEAATLPPGSPAIEVKTLTIKAKDQLESNYGNALYALPEVGRVTPPTKTQWGWDVILWSGGLTAKETTRAELEAEAFPDLRRSMFPIWVAQIARDLGVKPELDPAGVARLDEVGP
ncbi:MAG: hypothetical protein AB7L94_36150 [Kofleriaceae bacterium]